MHIRITKYVYIRYQKCIFALPNLHFPSPLRVCLRICGHDKSALQLLTAANYVANTLQNTQRTPTKWGANTPLGVGADSSCPYPNITKMHIPIIKYVYIRYQICISTLLNTCFHIIKYAFPLPISCVFTYMRAR